jgi:hypothetical protein
LWTTRASSGSLPCTTGHSLLALARSQQQRAEQGHRQGAQQRDRVDLAQLLEHRGHSLLS